MHDCIRAGECWSKRLRIENVALDQFEPRRQEFIAGAEIVENDDLVPGALQGTSRMTADISRTANDQNDQVASFRCSHARLGLGVEGSTTLYRTWDRYS